MGKMVRQYPRPTQKAGASNWKRNVIGGGSEYRRLWDVFLDWQIQRARRLELQTSLKTESANLNTSSKNSFPTTCNRQSGSATAVGQSPVKAGSFLLGASRRGPVASGRIAASQMRGVGLSTRLRHLHLLSGQEHGMATVEFALTLPAVILVTAICVSGLGAASAKIQACAEARNAARAMAIGGNGSVSGASAWRQGNWITGNSQKQVRGLGWAGLTVKCQLKIYSEPLLEGTGT